MKQYTINLTDAEDAALSHFVFSQDDWIQNAVHERCRLAIDSVVQVTVQKCLETNTSIPSSKDEIVALAFSKGWIKTGADIAKELDAQAVARAEELAASIQQPE